MFLSNSPTPPPPSFFIAVIIDCIRISYQVYLFHIRSWYHVVTITRFLENTCPPLTFCAWLQMHIRRGNCRSCWRRQCCPEAMEGMRGLPKFVLCNLPPKVILWLSDNGPNKLYDAFCVHNCLLWLLQYKYPGIWVQNR